MTILGSRGIPARHGGFETFAENLALYLASRDWEVTVYCQDGGDAKISMEQWNGICLIHIPVTMPAALGTIIFDLKSTIHTVKRKEQLVLTLGYNTAVFWLLYRVKGIINLANMDGIEWKRAKWSFFERAWLYLNERIGCWLGNHLIADHPEIKSHLSTRVSSGKITVIPYCADKVTEADVAVLRQFHLISGQYMILIARPEPENSILEIVAAFSRKIRNTKLVIVGHYEPEKNEYHRRVMNAASEEVYFIGAIYDRSSINALRFYAKMYAHGHRVGGTNPSLVEALGAGLPVLAQDNEFNRWVCGPAGRYFKNEDDCAEKMDHLLADRGELQKMKEESLKRYHEQFTKEKVLGAYEGLLLGWHKRVNC